MGKKVYANGKEIVAKASDCKVVAAMPDVCMSPPAPPAGPLPVPYPNSSFAKDLKSGSKKVKIGSQPVALQADSYYKSSPLGDEASTKSFGANVIDHGNAGKTHNAAFSMDVRIEGKCVPRAMDLTTSNHVGAQPSGGAMGPNLGGMALGAAEEKAKSERCECCGGPLHSEAQRRERMTSSEFYSPSIPKEGPPLGKRIQRHIVDAPVAVELSKEAGCGELVHEDDSDPCARHYPASSRDNDRARQEYAAMMSPSTPDDYFVDKYGARLGKEIQARGKRLYEALRGGAVSIAHRTPLCGGGCPVGERNLQPVSPDCASAEKILSEAQGNIVGYHRKVHRL